MKYLLTALLLLLCAASVQAGVFVGFGQSGGGGGGGISDTFDTDTSASYTKIFGGDISITGGYATLGGGWVNAAFYHETSTGSNDHYAEGVVERSSDGAGGLIVRCNGTTGYAIQVYHDGSQVNLIRFNGDSETWVGTFALGLTLGALPRFRLEAEGTNFRLYLHNGTSFDQVGSAISDSTYTTGSYIGMFGSNANGGAKIYSIAGGSL